MSKIKISLLAIFSFFQFISFSQGGFTAQLGLLIESCPSVCTGSVIISGNGGTGPFLALLTDQVSQDNILCNTYTDTTWAWGGLCPGDYIAYITDNNGVSVQVPFTVSEPYLDVYATSNYNGYNVSCNGGSNGSAQAVFVYTDMNNYISAIWSNQVMGETVSGLAAGSYYVDVSFLTYDNLGDPYVCVMTEFVNISEPDKITSVVTATNEISGNDGAIDLTVSGGVQPYTYNWTGINGFVSTDEDPTGLSPGLYEVLITDANGCTHSENIIVESVLSTTKLDAQVFKIAPNPAMDYITILAEQSYEVSICSVDGRIIESIPSSANKINVQGLEPGIYWVQLKFSNGEFAKQKFIKL